jgi:hypothetical protein
MADQPPQSPRRVPLGEPLDWTPEEMDALAEVSPQDVAESQAWVGRNADSKTRGLWEAQAKEEEQA